MNKILSPVDGSKQSVKAARYAIEIASKMGIHVDFVHILPSDAALYGAPLEGVGPDPAIIERRWEKEGQKILDRTIENIAHDHVNVTVNLKKGNAIKTILDVAGKGKYDMIIMGSRGLGMMKGALLGSVSSEVARKASCPVLIVH